jgi:hypothetical protein
MEQRWTCVEGAIAEDRVGRLLLSLCSVYLVKDIDMRTSDILQREHDITRFVRRAAVLPLVPQHLVEDPAPYCMMVHSVTAWVFCSTSMIW